MSAGKINQDWYDGARQNGTHNDIESWFSEMANAKCEIDHWNRVWFKGSHNGVCWLSQDRIDKICARIDAQ